jgi:hypothetical protein
VIVRIERLEDLGRAMAARYVDDLICSEDVQWRRVTLTTSFVASLRRCVSSLLSASSQISDSP